jgi:hypothetical protein
VEMRKLKSERMLSEAQRRSEASATACTYNSWQEEAALFLLRSGFMPADSLGQVKQVANPGREARTLGSVWHAMRSLVESEPERRALGAAEEESHARPLQ